MRLSTEDYIAVFDHMGRYCWAVDEGRAEDWVMLWTEDGVFTGIAPEPVVGREALKAVPGDAFRDHNGTMCHLAGNMYCDYGEDRNSVIARLYNYVTTWNPGEGGRNFVMAKCRVMLVRHGDGWLIKRNDAVLLA